jgi:NCS1 family nucleobase:cation symporter-1
VPGFVASVNTSITVTDAATELYYLNYLFGFLTSGFVFYILHLAFPSERVNEFVGSSSSPAEVQSFYRENWEVVAAQDLDQASAEHEDVEVAKKR